MEEKLGLLLNESTENGKPDDSDICSTASEHSVQLLATAVQKESKAFSQYTDLPTLLPILQAKNLVTGEELTQLLIRWEKGLRETTVCFLLQLLPRKGPQWALLLYESLQQEFEHRGHEYLVQVLRRAIQEDSELERSQDTECFYCQKCKQEIKILTSENRMSKLKSPFKSLTKKTQY